jgi:hypothetical protein
MNVLGHLVLVDHPPHSYTDLLLPVQSTACHHPPYLLRLVYGPFDQRLPHAFPSLRHKRIATDHQSLSREVRMPHLVQIPLVEQTHVYSYWMPDETEAAETARRLFMLEKPRL